MHYGEYRWRIDCRTHNTVFPPEGTVNKSTQKDLLGNWNDDGGQKKKEQMDTIEEGKIKMYQWDWDKFDTEK